MLVTELLLPLKGSFLLERKEADGGMYMRLSCVPTCPRAHMSLSPWLDASLPSPYPLPFGN